MHELIRRHAAPRSPTATLLSNEEDPATACDPASDIRPRRGHGRGDGKKGRRLLLALCVALALALRRGIAPLRRRPGSASSVGALRQGDDRGSGPLAAAAAVEREEGEGRPRAAGDNAGASPAARDDVVAAAAAAAREGDAASPRRRRQRRDDEYLTMIQIGANDGIQGNDAEVMKVLENPKSRAILVEGSPSVFRLLRKNIRERFDPTLRRIVPLNALVCEEGRTVEFHSPDVDKLMKASTTKDLQLPHWVQYQLSSLDRRTVRDGLSYYLRKEGKHFFDANATRAEDFVTTEALACASFDAILAEAPLFRAQEVQLLAVDVEGHEVHVLLESFKVEGLEPALILFEVKSGKKMYPREFDRAMDILRDERGYMSSCRKRDAGTCGEGAGPNKGNGNSTRYKSCYNCHNVNERARKRKT